MKKAFYRFRNENWCKEAANLDKLVRDNNGVKYIVVRQNLLDRTVDTKGSKKKLPNETVRVFSNIVTKGNRSMKIWVDKGTKIAGDF